MLLSEMDPNVEVLGMKFSMVEHLSGPCGISVGQFNLPNSIMVQNEKNMVGFSELLSISLASTLANGLFGVCGCHHLAKSKNRPVGQLRKRSSSESDISSSSSGSPYVGGTQSGGISEPSPLDDEVA